MDRFKFFSDGRWEDLLLLSRDSAVGARSKTLRASQELEEREVPPAVLGHDCRSCSLSLGFRAGC